MVHGTTDGGRGAVRERVGARWRIEHVRPVRSRKRGRRTGLTAGRGVKAAGLGEGDRDDGVDGEEKVRQVSLGRRRGRDPARESD